MIGDNKWSCLKIDEDGDVVNKTIVSIQEIITESITSKGEKEDLENKESNNEGGKGTKVFSWKMINSLKYFWMAYDVFRVHKVCYSIYGSNYLIPTLEFGIEVTPWINIASGKFDKKNKCSNLKCANLCCKI